MSDAKVVATVEKAANDETRTVKAHLDKAIADRDSLLSGSNGQVADNAVRDALKTVLDQVKVVQADTKADTNVRRKAIQDLDLASQMYAVNDSKAAKANADRDAVDQQAQQAAIPLPRLRREAAAPATPPPPLITIPRSRSTELIIICA